MRLSNFIILFSAVFCFSLITLQGFGAEEKEKVWYKVEIPDSANPIYIDYRSINKKGNIARYEQLEFLKEKQKVEGTGIEYQFIISKRETDCENKRYVINEEKYFDSELNYDTDSVTEEMVHKVKYKDNNGKIWKSISSDTPLEKVWKFICMYKANKN